MDISGSWQGHEFSVYKIYKKFSIISNGTYWRNIISKILPDCDIVTGVHFFLVLTNQKNGKNIKKIKQYDLLKYSTILIPIIS